MTSEPAGKGEAAGKSGPGRRAVSAAFAWFQDAVYVALAVLLAASAIALLVHGGIDLARALVGGDVRLIVALLDRVLLALMIVELLYTVQVSFREHVLVPEPFVLVALIAAVRRILIITAEFGAETRPEADELRLVLWELALLAGLVAVLVGSLVALRRGPGAAPGAEASRTTA